MSIFSFKKAQNQSTLLAQLRVDCAAIAASEAEAEADAQSRLRAVMQNRQMESEQNCDALAKFVSGAAWVFAIFWCRAQEASSWNWIGLIMLAALFVAVVVESRKIEN
jgi:hypothetical protein